MAVEAKSNIGNGTIAVGAKLGVFGIQATVSVIDAVQTVGDWFKSAGDYISNLVHESVSQQLSPDGKR